MYIIEHSSKGEINVSIEQNAAYGNYIMNFSERIFQGLCGFCGENKLINATECICCRQERRQRQRSEYEKYNRIDAHRKRWNKRKKAGLCVRCGQPSNIKKNCNECLKKQKESEKKLKDKVFARYGGYICNCCNETIKEFLTLDHKNDDGAAHRRELGKNKGSGKSLHRWIIKNNYPPMFQVLCFNCNCGRKINGGICPHRTESGLLG